ncbi:YkgJ family cysteine cluster protein [Paenibacillus xerothermodurans]|uniref:YkgJ family cysteine cluster protein n=1 Tax=Paenibacillus xerothermodurans TaxID=1977292 RepID=A0A2W1NV15_PAEXE|nr:YkgJ family cysteine cluster protein [Paenibacillus xerothermodurans]PZE21606.1 YkgJ family cysteine cluster protein [Paenibacillus xerothermodurans]
MDCRIGCAACCVAVSISSPIPGMPQGKPAGVPCIQLTSDNRCRLFGHPERPAVCSSLAPSVEMCGQSNEEAYRILSLLEQATSPVIRIDCATVPILGKPRSSAGET